MAVDAVSIQEYIMVFTQFFQILKYVISFPWNDK